MKNENLKFLFRGNKIKPGVIAGLGYGCFRKGQSPITKIYPSTKQVEEDLKLIKGCKKIRSYAVHKIMQDIPKLAKKIGIECWPAAFVERNPWFSEKEVKNIITLAKEKIIKKAIVGDMVITRKLLPISKLIKYIREVKKQIKIPVSTGNHWHSWTRYPQLVSEVDFICVGVYPYWKGVSIEKSQEFLDQVLQKLKKINPKNKPMVLDSGWPSKGETMGQAECTSQNQAKYIKLFINWCKKNKIDYFIFESFDSPWKKIYEKEAGSHWGVYTVGRKPKV